MNTLPLFDICENRHRGAPASVEANRRVDKADGLIGTGKDQEGEGEMTLEDLLREIGPENTRYHWLDEVTTNIHWSGKSALSRVTFKTDQPVVLDGDGGSFRDVGIIIWLPRKRTEQLLSELREGKTK